MSQTNQIKTFDESYFYDRKPLVDKHDDVIDFHPYRSLDPEKKAIFDLAHKENRLWSIVSGDDGGLYLLNGSHFVNTFAQFITELPWEHENIEITWSEPDPDEDADRF